MGVRNRARKFLLQARYAAMMNGDPLDNNLETLGLSARFAPPERLWIAGIARAVTENIERIDGLIEGCLENWRLERLNPLSRLLIEQALAEVLYTGTDAPVAIDEAVELAREFEGDEAAGFVNAVLDRAIASAGRPS
ncbi:transcription antitermination factor NusB [Candidatus Fermentibacteria bacterium]|nr:transcription antitermination factor NusB [Candidatus Fermentibacteria bacterium]